jgi:predicted polyphosphate/ATP-dependent NAD kinase
VHLIDMAVSDGPGDSAVAAGLLQARGVALIAVLGGDGTHRAVAAHCGAVPLATLSTGTNNAFPERREATLVGMAAALVATGRVPPDLSLRSNKVLHVRGVSVDERALVDVAVSREPLLGARAVGDGGTLGDLFVSFAEPNVIGLSAIAGLLRPVARDEPSGVRVRFGPGRRLWAPILPGALEAVSVAGVELLHPGQRIPLPAVTGTLALDGEREIEFDAGSGLTIELRLDGPRTVAVEAVLAYAARHGLLADGAAPGSV